MKVEALIAGIFILCAVEINADSTPTCQWEIFKVMFNKTYTSADEEQKRKEIFMDNTKLIEAHNKKNSTFSLKMNQFGDLTHDDFIKSYTNENTFLIGNRKIDSSFTSDHLVNSELPKSIDLRNYRLVSPVKDQSQIPEEHRNKSWAFSVIGALESTIFKNQPFTNYNKRFGKCSEEGESQESFSEQFLIDCTSIDEEYVNKEVSHVKNGFAFLNKKKGIYSEKLYSCMKNMKSVLAESCSYKIPFSVCFKKVLIHRKSREQIKIELHEKNAVAAYMDASDPNLQFYEKGIYTESKHSPTMNTEKYNHAVLIIGYGNVDGIEYWLVKNSWGTSWGDKGYLQIATGTCGIDEQAMIPLPKIVPCK